MKRNTIHLLYEIFKDWKGCIVMMGLYMLVHICMGAFVKSMGWNNIWITPVWGVAGILIFSWLNKTGYKIGLEKARFERWRDIISSDEATSAEKEAAAWKILKSKDLNEYALRDLFFHLSDKPKIIDSVLMAYNQLKLKTPEHEERN